MPNNKIGVFFYSLEGAAQVPILGGTLYMRPKDHQMIQDIHISVHTDQDIVIDGDNSGFRLLTESTVTAAGMDSPTTCQMERPES